MDGEGLRVEVPCHTEVSARCRGPPHRTSPRNGCGLQRVAAGAALQQEGLERHNLIHGRTEVVETLLVRGFPRKEMRVDQANVAKHHSHPASATQRHRTPQSLGRAICQYAQPVRMLRAMDATRNSTDLRGPNPSGGLLQQPHKGIATVRNALDHRQELLPILPVFALEKVERHANELWGSTR